MRGACTCWGKRGVVPGMGRKVGLTLVWPGCPKLGNRARLCYYLIVARTRAASNQNTTERMINMQKLNKVTAEQLVAHAALECESVSTRTRLEGSRRSIGDLFAKMTGPNFWDLRLNQAIGAKKAEHAKRLGWKPAQVALFVTMRTTLEDTVTAGLTAQGKADDEIKVELRNIWTGICRLRDDNPKGDKARRDANKARAEKARAEKAEAEKASPLEVAVQQLNNAIVAINALSDAAGTANLHDLVLINDEHVKALQAMVRVYQK